MTAVTCVQPRVRVRYAGYKRNISLLNVIGLIFGLWQAPRQLDETLSVAKTLAVEFIYDTGLTL